MSALPHALARRRTGPPRPCSCPVALPCECSYATLLRTRARSGASAMRGRTRAGRRRGDALLHNGHMLAASSLVAAGLGSVFWLLATRSYDVETVGRSYAALAAAMLLSTLGSLNLGEALVRFVPSAGRHTRALVLRCYAISTGLSVLVAAGFLLLVPVVAPDLGFLRDPAIAVAFMAATAGYSVFVLQDGALTGARRTGWVLGENTLFAVAKAVLLGACAWLAVEGGIMLAWAAAMVVSIALANVVLFRHALPAHHRAAPADQPPPERVMRWASADYLGNLFSFGTYSVVPLMVLHDLGAEGSAYYSLAFVIASTLFVVTYNMGDSLVVEGARDPQRLAELARRMLRHTGLLVTAAAVVVIAAAPWILGVFGADYAANGTTVLRLLALCALPVVVVNVVLQIARVRRRLRWMVGVRMASAVMITGLVAVLLPGYGLTGVGIAWVTAQYTLALAMLFVLRRWLHSTERGEPDDH